MEIAVAEEELTGQPTLEMLQPGGMSGTGFLEKSQTLEQVLERDRRALEILGYSTQEVANLLGPLNKKAVENGKNFDYSAPNGKQYEVKIQAWRGIQECPWHDRVDGRKSHGGIDMYLTEKGKSGEPVHIAGLVRHLVESHGFFEGGSFRVAPETIVELFGTERVPGSFEKVKELRIK